MKIQHISSGSPALARYTEEALLQGAWQRPALSLRDRGIITLASVITRSQPDAVIFYTHSALEHGVTPREISEIVTHLAFYAGWCNGS
ncbi:carboxymuconolactone decarboxylase family protein [Paraburkholderia sediminicola]|uniref:Carboxymuconolactone decarboxylase family protein n=1 Tax=Paraburkholderia metrosideri TaxID=580937 RepID=A0ABW9E552_9BURK